MVGGLGARAHGACRPTDIDFVPETSEENYERLAVALRELGARLRVGGMTDEDARQLPAPVVATPTTSWLVAVLPQRSAGSSFMSPRSTASLRPKSSPAAPRTKRRFPSCASFSDQLGVRNLPFLARLAAMDEGSTCDRT